MSKFELSQRSLDRLKGVNPLLVNVVKKAITLSDVDFTVIEGVRSLERQKELFAQHKTKTMNSRHLTGHAVDLAPISADGSIPWNDFEKFREIKKAMYQAAEELSVRLRWGGDWNGDGVANEKFVDGPHYELPRSVYP